MANKNQTSTITLGLRDLFSGGLVAAGAAATGFTKHLDGLNQRMSAVAGRLNAVGASFTSNFSIPAGLAFAAATQGAANAETAFIDVERAFGEGTLSMRQMQEQAARLGLSVADLGNRMADVGFAGIESPTEALKFVDLARKSAVAFNVPLQQINDNMMAIRSGYGLTFGGVQQALEGMNIAADASSAKVADIADATQRLASYGRLLRISAADMAAYSAAGISAGLSSERMATGLNSVFRSLTAGGTATKRIQEGFAAIGLTAEDVQQRMNLDPDATLRDVLERLNGIEDASKRISTINSLVGADNGDEVAVLVGQLEEVRRIQSEIAAKSGGSIDREFEKRGTSLSTSLGRLGASFKNLGVGIGSVFAPEMAKVAGLFEGLNTKIAQNPTAVRAMASALVAVAAAGPGLMLAGKALSMFSTLGSLAAFATRPIGLLGETLTATAAAISGFGTKGGRAAASAAATLAIRFASLGAAGLALAGAAALIYASWAPLSKAFADFANNPSLRSALTNAGEALNKLLDGNWNGFALHAGVALRAISRAVGDLVRSVGTTLKPAWDAAIKWLDSRFPSFRGLRDALSKAGAAVANALGAVFGLAEDSDVRTGMDSLARLFANVANSGMKVAADSISSFAAAINTIAEALKNFRAAGDAGISLVQRLGGLWGDLPAPARFLVAAGGLIAVGRAFKFLAGSIEFIAAAKFIGGFRGAMLALTRLPVAGIFLMGAALGELAKGLGLIDENADTIAWAGYAAGIALVGKQFATAIGFMLRFNSATRGAAAAGARTAGAYAAGASGISTLAATLGAGLGKVWSGLKTAVARTAGALAGVAYSAGAKIGEKISGAVSSAWSSLKIDVASAKGTAMGRAMGSAFRGAFYAAGILTAIDMISQIPSDAESLKKFMDDNRRRAEGFSNRLDDATGFSITRNWLRELAGFDPLKRNGKPYEFQGPQLPAGLKAANDNMNAAAKAVTVQAPVVNIARAPVSSQIPGEGMTGGRFPGKDKDDLDIGLLRASTDRTASSVEALRGEMKAELGGVRAGIESTNSRLDSINSGISQIPPAIRAGLSWANQRSEGTPPGGVPRVQVNSNGVSGVR